MTDANPYNAPDAVLDTMQEASYQPTIFSFKGRIGRMRYLAYYFGTGMLLGIMVWLVMGLVGVTAFMGGDVAMSPMILGAFLIFSVAGLVLMIMFGKRRLNDLNRSGWWILLLLAPYLSFINPFLGLLVLLSLPMMFYLIFFSGTQGDNDFGPAPPANSVGVLIVAWIAIVLFILAIVGIGAAVVIPQLTGMSQ